MPHSGPSEGLHGCRDGPVKHSSDKIHRTLSTLFLPSILLTFSRNNATRVADSVKRVVKTICPSRPPKNKTTHPKRYHSYTVKPRAWLMEKTKSLVIHYSDVDVDRGEWMRVDVQSITPKFVYRYRNEITVGVCLDMRTRSLAQTVPSEPVCIPVMPWPVCMSDQV